MKKNQNKVIPFSDPYKVMGATLKRLRTESGMTQRYVAEKINITEGFLSFLETGTKHGSVDTYMDLCTVYGCHLVDLFGEAPAPKIARREILDLTGIPKGARRLLRQLANSYRSK